MRDILVVCLVLAGVVVCVAVLLVRLVKKRDRLESARVDSDGGLLAPRKAMGPQRGHLLDVIEGIADGLVVDWATLEADVTDEGDRRMLAQLKILASIADVHRSQPDDPADHVIPVRRVRVLSMHLSRNDEHPSPSNG
jgi:hypothetical protein